AGAGHHEWQIAEERNAAETLARRLPLIAGNPLDVLPKQHLALELGTRLTQRVGLAAPERLRPRHPRALVETRVKRAKERVIVQPPGLLVAVAPERRATS